MVADVINFPIKKVVVPTPEEVEAKKLQDIEDCIDKNIRNFILDIIESISDIDEDRLENIDTPTQKVIGLVRETMRATIYMLQGVHHDLQVIADEIICFDEDAREQVIEGNE